MMEYIAVILLSRLIRSIPLTVALFAGKCLGLFIFYLVPIRKKVSLDNLRSAFPEKTAKELTRIARRAYINFSLNMIEFMRLPLMTPDYLNKHVTFVNPEILDQMHKEAKGTISMTGHFGNWELMGAAIVARGFPMMGVVKEQHNKRVDRLINQYRDKVGIGHLYLGMAVRGVMKSLKNNLFVVLVADQDAHDEGVFVDFLGRPSSTAPGPALFALKTGAPIMFGTAVRIKDSDHVIYLEKIDHSDLDGLTEKNIHELTQRHARVLERNIRRWPDHWFWMHKRWKTKPGQKLNDEPHRAD
jgi:Kdo2-lipid IVA lauroyltransferase/acyltransferase